VTGWKVGTVVAPAALTAEFRKVHQFAVFTVNTPMQFGLAGYMSNPQAYLELPQFYQRKRDLFREGLSKTKFSCQAKAPIFNAPIFPICRYQKKIWVRLNFANG